MTASHLRAALDSSRDHLFTAIRGLSEEQFRFTPPGSDWNIAAHLAHLLRIERVYADRAAAAVREDRPRVPSTRAQNDDDPAVAQRLAVPQIIHGMQAARRDLVAVLDGGHGVLAREIDHELLGLMSIEAIMEKMAAHEREHAEAVGALAAQAAAAVRVSIALMQR